MNLGDLLAGKKDDREPYPDMVTPSDVKLVVEPSVALLAEIDRLIASAKPDAPPKSREQWLLDLAGAGLGATTLMSAVMRVVKKAVPFQQDPGNVITLGDMIRKTTT